MFAPKRIESFTRLKSLGEGIWSVRRGDVIDKRCLPYSAIRIFWISGSVKP